jgi:hypothetical protein
MEHRERRKRERRQKDPLAWVTVQFDIPPDDDTDFMELVGELKNRSTVARMLFLYGLNNSKAAFAAYAERHEIKRRRRLESKTSDEGAKSSA